MMSSGRIQYAKFEGDIATIIQECLAIEALSFERGIRYGYDTLKYCLQKWPILLAIEADSKQIVGYLIYEERKNENHIISLSVHPAYRGQKIGSSLIADLRDKQIKPITIETRPYNEPFYRKLGFSAYGLNGYYQKDYYRYTDITNASAVVLPGIPMRLSLDKKPVNDAGKVNFKIKHTELNHEHYRKMLLKFAERAKGSTSIFYGSVFARLFRSGRKEKAFHAIICELKALGNAETITRDLNPAAVLQSIIYNALVVRGGGNKSLQTTSGKKLVELLNTSEFADLKALMVDHPSAMTYAGLQTFSELHAIKKADDTKAPYTPYRHF